MKKPFGKTIRQEVIDHAALKLRRGITDKPEIAIESVIDGARTGTLGGMMKDYVLGLNDAAYQRLERAIKREAK